MRKLQKMLRRIRRAEEGQSMVEYGLIIGLIAIVVIAVLTLLGHNLNGLFGKVNTSVATANSVSTNATP